MLLPRIIPCLLKREGALVKTVKYRDFNYIGDPVNTIQIFNELEVDELVILDIQATKEGKNPDFTFIKDIASECFMPLSYGGGVKSIRDMKKIFVLGVEKIIIGSEAVKNPDFIYRAAQTFGSQSIVVSIDVKKGDENKAIQLAQTMEIMGAGEILLNAIDHDGMMAGYDLSLIKSVSSNINIPLIANCGAGNINDLKTAYRAGAQAMAAGSLFVYQGKNRSVLVNFPDRDELEKLFPVKQMKVMNLTRKIYLKYKKDILNIDSCEMRDYESWESKNFLLGLKRKFVLSSVVLADNQVAGYLVASQKNDFIVIHRIVVDKNYQNQGVGSILLNALGQKSKKFGLKNIISETLSKSSAHSFYLKNGFLKINGEIRKNFLTHKDDISRQKTLQNSTLYLKKL